MNAADPTRRTFVRALGLGAASLALGRPLGAAPGLIEFHWIRLLDARGKALDVWDFDDNPGK